MVARAYRRWTDPLVLLTFLAVLGAAVTLVIVRIPQFPGDSSPEAGFARDMMDHHAQAVEIAEIVRTRTTDPAIRTMAADIALTQQAQIGQMQGWLDEWGLTATGEGPRMAWMGQPVTARMPGMAAQVEVNALSKLPQDQLNLSFLRLLIRHHTGGVGMAQGILSRTERPEVLRLASSIVASQQSEIDAMQDMLRARGAAPEQVTLNDMGMAGMGAEEEGVLATAASAARATLRLIFLPLAVFAVAWLVLDSVRRERGFPAARWLGWRTAAAVGLVSSAVLHVGLAPEHFAESPAFGVFFAASGALAAVTAAAVVAAPTRATYSLGAALALGLIVLWAVFRLVPPPGAEGGESVDLVGLATKGAEMLALVSCLVLLSRERHAARVGVGRQVSG